MSKSSNNKSEIIPDVLVRSVGTLFLFCPLTKAAKDWIAAHVQSEATWFGNTLAVECRYTLLIALGMKEDGLLVEGE